MSDQLNLANARRARDRGIQRAAGNAGEPWIERAVADFVRFVRERGETTCEQWRYDWLSRGEDPPPSHNAYGAVAAVACRRKLVVNTRRYVKAQSEKTHAHPVPLWRAA